MKIALLVCDHVADEYVDDYGTYFEMFSRLLPNVEIEPYFIIDYFFPELDEYDAFICTGSKFSVYDSEPWIPHLLALIREINIKEKKFIGVCFGHQALALALGGTVEKADTGYLIGIHEFLIREKQTWMTNEKVYKVLMLCQDQVKLLPKRSVVLASSEECPVAMFTVGNNMMGIQGHPEFSKEYNRSLFEKRLKNVASEKVQMAISSLQNDADSALIASWMHSFLLNNS